MPSREPEYALEVGPARCWSQHACACACMRMHAAVSLKTLGMRMQDLQFGRTFTDHLLTAEHVEGKGWGRPQIRPFAHGITVHPAATVLHYGMCCFEGMKAYHGADGRGRLFRHV